MEESINERRNNLANMREKAYKLESKQFMSIFGLEVR